MAFSSGDIIECEISDISFGGDGVARLADGAVLFVPFSAVGDRLKVAIVQCAKNFYRGEIREILNGGAGRCEPVCPHYGDCGGCCYQHLEYPVELAAKRTQFLAAMRRLGHFEEFPEPDCVVASEKRYGYRNKLRLEPFRRPGMKEVHYGFCERDNATFFPVRSCALAQDALNQALPAAKRDPRAAKNAHAKKPSPLTIRVDARGQTACYFDYASPKMPWLRENLLDSQVAVPVGSFWQVNPFTAEKLLRHVRSWLEPLPNRALIDAYGGIGTFSLALGDLFQYRVVIESDKQAVACSESNHRERNLKARFLARTTEDALEEVLAKTNRNECCVILDPPRTGCLPKAIKTLLDFPVSTLVYVSCNASTLARDLKVLSAKYTPVRSAVFDMFPATAHFESAVLLRSRDALEN